MAGEVSVAGDGPLLISSSAFATFVVPEEDPLPLLWRLFVPALCDEAPLDFFAEPLRSLELTIACVC